MHIPFDAVWSRTPKEGFVPIEQGKHGYIAEEVARKAYEGYHYPQTFERMYERGGLSAIEIIYYMYIRLKEVEG